MARARFNPDDLAELTDEAEAIQNRLERLSARMLEANLSHTEEGFYDSRVRRIADRLWTKMSDVKMLLWDDQQRQPARDEARQSEVRA